ncbi:hypothetical protein CDIK_4266 [Cucumispora dikerogammari]|nr:hypothetical protein CDIK_4266 [Cucumispora dikerogammari]
MSFSLNLKKMNISKLIRATKTNARTILFCQEIGLISKWKLCPSCGESMNLHRGGGCIENLRWRCDRPCRKEISLRKQSFFQGSNLPIRKIIRFIYFWAFEEVSQLRLKRELRFAKQTSTDWKNFLREVCVNKLLLGPSILGGPGRVVQIDETQMTRRKNNVGRVQTPIWVFGGIDCTTKKSFLFEVEDRSAASLMPLILQYIRPGTTIVSDCWAAYNKIGQHDYSHLTVNHSLYFVDPETRANTNRVENMWMRAKRRHKRECGTRRTALTSYLFEFMWRQIYGKNPFKNIIKHIKLFYFQ